MAEWQAMAQAGFIPVTNSAYIAMPTLTRKVL